MKAECINTGRLMLRDIDEQDTELIVKWRSDPEIYKFFRYPHCLTAQEHLEWYRKYYLRDKQRYIWMAIEMKDNVSIGTFGLKKAEGCEAEISYLVAPEAQGKGYAYEAVDFLIAWAEKKWHSRAVFAEIHYKNEASIRFVQRLGFEKSGVNENFLIYKRML